MSLLPSLVIERSTGRFRKIPLIIHLHHRVISLSLPLSLFLSVHPPLSYLSHYRLVLWVISFCSWAITVKWSCNVVFYIFISYTVLHSSSSAFSILDSSSSCCFPLDLDVLICKFSYVQSLCLSTVLLQHNHFIKKKPKKTIYIFWHLFDAHRYPKCGSGDIFGLE